MATGSSDRQAAQGGGRARAWLIIAAVALVLILAFWLFDATGADPTGDDIDPTTDEAPEDESPDVDFGEPEDEPPETEEVP